MIFSLKNNKKYFTSLETIILFFSIFFLCFFNISFFKKIIGTYPLTSSNIPSLISLIITLFCVFYFLLNLFLYKKTYKVILPLFLVISSLAAFFMDQYSISISTDIVRNTLETNFHEAFDLFTPKLLLYIVFGAILPSFFVWKIELKERTYKKALLKKTISFFLPLLFILLNVFLFSKFYSSFLREHKSLRYYTNPSYWIYSIGKYTSEFFKGASTPFTIIGDDAKIDQTKEREGLKELIIMVVGETARSDRFSLNGYHKETNPLLKKENVLSFKNVTSCSTSTAKSLPCMFSPIGKDSFSVDKVTHTSNLLDILSYTHNVKILWRDNNSDSKGVASRIEYQDYKTKKLNAICDTECRDEGMLDGLDEFISQNKNEDILIVLHQMGSHGPAYYKRFPESFAKFKPYCKTSELNNCTQEEINNAYDNTIAYTDYFLSKTINFLKKYNRTHEVGMFYMSDHGESLGENGVYLHGLSPLFAPNEQVHVPFIVWLGDILESEYKMSEISPLINKNYTHDNLFHTILGVFEVNSNTKNENKDILTKFRKDIKF